jgi:hypothetical protein
MLMGMSGGWRWVVLASCVTASGCATARPATEATPAIPIRPGVAERIALMDQYRLGDDIRKRMMARPHVWVEEVQEPEAEAGVAGEDAETPPTTP